MLHAVIMAGGAGTRFWPESRAKRPKQLLRLTGEKTLLEQTLDRLAGLVTAERTLIATSQTLAPEIARLLPGFDPRAIIAEPCKRDTAPCIGLAASLLLARDPEAVMVVCPSDHVIESTEQFQGALALAARLVAESPARLATFGIRPTYPAESFGYIERGAGIAGAPGVYQVTRFREKPKAAQAAEYLASGKFYWNSGIFVWRAKTIRDALAAREPEMVALLDAIAATAEKPQFAATFEREFAKAKSISIDYAVMEHATDVVVVEAPFAWDDVGSWQALSRLLPADAAGNTTSGRHVGLDTSGSIVRAGDDHLVVTLGVKDLIIVHTPDATLVANKHDEESIRRLTKLLEERGLGGYL